MEIQQQEHTMWIKSGMDLDLVLYHGVRNLEADTVYKKLRDLKDMKVPLTIKNEENKLLRIDTLTFEIIENDREHGIVICEVKVSGVVI